MGGGSGGFTMLFSTSFSKIFHTQTFAGSFCNFFPHVPRLNSATLISTCFGSYLNFFCQVASKWNAGTQASWPIALSLSFQFIGGYSAVQPHTEGHNTAQSRLFDLIWKHPGKPQDLHPYLFQYQAFTQNVFRRFLLGTTSPA